jgi:hypothetical protein
VGSPEKRDYGCVTNFEHDGQRLTIWRYGERYRLMEFGVLGKVLPMTEDPIFQSIATELHRLACEVGRLRRAEIEHERKQVRAIEEDAEELRLLRAIEDAQNALLPLPPPMRPRGPRPRGEFAAAQRAHEERRAAANDSQDRLDEAWQALRDFRARQASRS